MDLENILDQEVLEAEVTRALRIYSLHPQDTILRDNFNGLQMMYKEVFGSFYIPCITCSMPIDISGYDEDIGRGNYD